MQTEISHTCQAHLLSNMDTYTCAVSSHYYGQILLSRLSLLFLLGAERSQTQDVPPKVITRRSILCGAVFATVFFLNVFEFSWFYLKFCIYSFPHPSRLSTDSGAGWSSSWQYHGRHSHQPERSLWCHRQSAGEPLGTRPQRQGL